jgi:hypothetical protein
MPDDDVAFVNMSIRESKWRQITKTTIVLYVFLIPFHIWDKRFS